MPLPFVAVGGRPYSGVARNFRQGASTDAHIVCRIRLESIEARLSLTDKNIGTSARFTRRPITLKSHTKNYVFS